jgi:hypothetical protein
MAERAGGWLYPALAALAGALLLFPPLVLTRQDLVRTRARLMYAERDAESAAAAVLPLDAAGLKLPAPSQPVAFEVEAGPGRVILYLESGGRRLARREVVAVASGRAVLMVSPALLTRGTYQLRVESSAGRREFPVRVE